MLKECWIVNNLYTISPIKNDNSITLYEHIIDMRLRLPYELRTENNNVDHLTILAHYKFEELIYTTNDSNSISEIKNILSIDDKNNQNEKEIQVDKL